jgi:hypothetical protein
MSIAYAPTHTCATVVRDRACRNAVREPGALCWRHRDAPAPAPRTLAAYRALFAEIDAALLDGADERVWPPGLTRAEAITRLVRVYVTSRRRRPRRVARTVEAESLPA